MQVEHRHPSDGRLKRLAWFVALYLASLAAFALFVYGLREFIPR
jgi:hypothetical protein